MRLITDFCKNTFIVLLVMGFLSVFSLPAEAAAELILHQPAISLAGPRSDLFAGKIVASNSLQKTFVIRLGNGGLVAAKLTPETIARVIANFDETPVDCTNKLRRELQPGRYVFVQGVVYPDSAEIAAGNIWFTGADCEHYRFEEADWWARQIKSLGDFYLKAQFPDGKIDYTNYRTNISLEGHKRGDGMQETDTISRLVYGFASAYLLTGEERFREAAEQGVLYLRRHMRRTDKKSGGTYWLHALDIASASQGLSGQILASNFRDDRNSIPLYEQIYAIAGAAQTMRITGDPKIMTEIDSTMQFFEAYYRDRKDGGFFSHVDPVTFKVDAMILGDNRSRKNWNSIGDHIPAFLINYWLATGKQSAKELLVELGKIVADRFFEPSSPFVQERFFADWTHDRKWKWQKDRGVIGHNLKIAWNLMRLYNLDSEPAFLQKAELINRTMPEISRDVQRGGWYDVMERSLAPGHKLYRFPWHDRKVWWQQEQAILAYQIFTGVTGASFSLELARESSAFYNAWFLDHEDGGVYFNLTADGLPYLRGLERQKGGHSMSGYHTFELCYLGAVYNNLLIRKCPLDLYFRPVPGAFGDGILRVAPDILPPGRVKIANVWVEGKPYANFDAVKMLVTLPKSRKPLKVKVRLVPVQ